MTTRYDPDRHHRRSIRVRGYDYAGAGAYFVTICALDRSCLFGDVVNDAMRLNDAGRMARAFWEVIATDHPGVAVDAFVIMPNHLHGVIVFGGPTAPTVPGARASADAEKWKPGGGDDGGTEARRLGVMNRAPTVGNVAATASSHPATVDHGGTTGNAPDPPAPPFPVGARFIAPGVPCAAPIAATRAGAEVGAEGEARRPGAINRAPTTGDVAAMTSGAGWRPITGHAAGRPHRAPTVGDVVRAYKARVTVAINRQHGVTGVPVWQRNYYERITRDAAALDRIRQYIADNPAYWARDPENSTTRSQQ